MGDLLVIVTLVGLAACVSLIGLILVKEVRRNDD